ncbi:MAG: hypothetical protein LBT97_03175 [Planctomycetota bacterium]|jgi:hypothetical protein|nr:hypothetical protein [Planctomycetota bacterium]
MKSLQHLAHTLVNRACSRWRPYIWLATLDKTKASVSNAVDSAVRQSVMAANEGSALVGAEIDETWHSMG